MGEKPGACGKNVAVDLLFPRRCPVCDRPVRPFGGRICSACAKALQKKRLSERDSLCCRCGKPLTDVHGELCRDCQRTAHAFQRGCAAYRYRDISGALYRLKYQGRAEYAEWMGEQIAVRLQEEFCPEAIDALTPVPISRERLRKRGYNQAALLARSVSAAAGIPVRESYLVRKTDTAVLRGMGAAERRSKIKNAFIAPVHDVESKVIMLIDDIYTTGATMDACAASLLHRGAAVVLCAVLAIGEDAYDQSEQGSPYDEDGGL